MKWDTYDLRNRRHGISEGDSDVNDALPFSLSWCRKSAFPVSFRNSVHPMAGLRPPNRWIQPLSSQMVFVSTVGFMVPPHFGRTVKRDGLRKESADFVGRHAGVLSLETRDISRRTASFFAVRIPKIPKI
jgi:hypothetical protein